MIEFPVDRDQLAVTKACRQLLEEGWRVESISSDNVVGRRTWEVEAPQVVGPLALPGR